MFFSYLSVGSQGDCEKLFFCCGKNNNRRIFLFQNRDEVNKLKYLRSFLLIQAVYYCDLQLNFKFI